MARTAASVVTVLLAAIALAIALPSRAEPASVAIDTSFLIPLCSLPVSLPVSRPFTDAEEQRYGDLIWSNFNELEYLARRGRPAAVRACVRIISTGRIPGGCSCDHGRLEGEVFGEHIPGSFWDAVLELPTDARVKVIVAMDRVNYGEHTAEVPWCDERDRFLAANEGTRRVYVSTLAAAETSQPASE